MNHKKSAIVLLLALGLTACGGGGNSGGFPFVPPGSTTPPPGDGGGDPGPTDPQTPEPEVPNPPDPETPDPTAEVYIDESFDGLSALPEGWKTPAWNMGTVRVEDGSLYIDGRAHSTAMTAVVLPESLLDKSNYRIDVTFTFDAPNNTGRWGSVMYRVSPPAASAVPYEPYYQMAVRFNATAANGTEVARRANAQWQVTQTAAFTENIDPTKTYKATVIVHGNRVRQYLDGVLLHEETLDEAMAQGGIGLSTAGLVMRVDSIKVTEQITPLPDVSSIIAVQDTGTAASIAPTLVQSMHGQVDLPASRASNALYHLDSSLNLTSDGGESLATLAHLLAQTDRATIPVLRIRDAATVTALQAFAQDQDVGDVTLLSDNVELLAQARQALPSVRTAVDFSDSAFLGGDRNSILQVMSATNRAKAKIAVLPPAMLERATVAHLQRLLITAWAKSDAATPTEAAEVLLTGVNGVIASNAAAFTAVLQALPAGTLLRKPLVTGHRGQPGTRDENTLEGAWDAVNAGADAVENDIYLTTDGHIVVMHDGTVDRTTTGTGAIESMTLEQVQQLRTQPGGYAVPTLDAYFQAFKGLPITQFVEIKSAKPEIVTKLKEAIERHGVQDQVIVISFLGDQLKRMGEVLPEVSVGFLTSVSGGDKVRAILNATQAYSSTFNPSYNGLDQETMEAAKHRGTTFWPWTYRDQNHFYQYYSYGTHGLTTDDAWWAKDFPVAVQAAGSATATVGQPFTVPLTLATQVGGSLAADSNLLLVIEGTAQHSGGPDGALTFSSQGTATVLPGYTYRMGDGTYSYTLFGQPVQVTVQ